MKSYPAKILLFGEYTIIHHSSALAIPYFKYESHWSDERSEDPSFVNKIEESYSVSTLKEIYNDLKKLKNPKLNLKKFMDYINDGLWICSNSPLGYGLGSSGAVSAAIYDRFSIRKEQDPVLLKSHLSRIENAFHGKSSGIDPLVSYVKKPLWIHQDESIEFTTIPSELEGGTLFLLDTKLNRNSTPLINHYLQKSSEDVFVNKFIEPVKINVERAIEGLINNDFKKLSDAFASISILQFMHLPPMVTEKFKDLWHEGIDTNDYYLKICGAGGGGYILGITHDIQKTRNHFEGHEIMEIL